MTNLLLFPIDEGDESEKNKSTRRAKSRKKGQPSAVATTVPKELLFDPPMRLEKTVTHDQTEGPGAASSSPQTPPQVISPSEVISLSNRLIRASAGTGKTYQLTSRYLQLLLLGAAPESILATTFTRKAAGEILDRVVLWLARAAAGEDELRNLANAVEIPDLTTDDCKQKLAVLTRHMHRLKIHTIDAFFMQIALAFSLELGIAPGWQILEEGTAESSLLRDEAIAEVLRGESLDDLLVLVHQLAPKGEVKRSLDGMLRNRVADAYRLFLDSTADAWQRLSVPAPLHEDDLYEIVRSLSSFQDKRKTIVQAINADVGRIHNKDWRGFFESGPTLVKSINEGATKYRNANIPPELVQLYLRFLPHLRAMVLQSASAQTRATHEFLSKYHRHYGRLKESQRLYGFAEVTDLLAAQAEAQEPSAIAFRMDARIDHLLLDEFQDTSVPQWKALAKLAERCTQAQTNRSFLCVGDVKQAIYGWRGGSSEIFDVLDQRLPNLLRSELKESRRSSPIIIDVVNRVFETLPQWDAAKLGRAARAAKRWEFVPHRTHRKDLPGHFTIETADLAENSKQAQEAAVLQRAAERVAAISKQAPSRTIGILCRRNDKVAQTMNWLQRLGVPASEEGGNLLTDSESVSLVLSRLHLIDHPADSVTAFHLATSPWADSLDLQIGVCQPSAADEANPAQRRTPPAGMDPRAINALVRRSRTQLLADGYGNTVQSWAMELRRSCNRREARRLTQLVEMAYEYQNRIEHPSQFGYERQRRQSIRPGEFVRFVRETKVADPSNATIRVMTVHQAKGLEFDIVILPDLLGPFVEGHDTFLYRRRSLEAPIDLVCRYMGRDSGRSFLPKEFLPLFDQFEDRKTTESLCVLYVAMTRAIHALHVFLPSGLQPLKMPKSNAAYLIKDAFAPGVKLEPSGTLYEAGDKHWFINDPDARSECAAVDLAPLKFPQPRLARSKSTGRHLETVAPSQLSVGKSIRLADRISGNAEPARVYGTLMHLWLSQIRWLEECSLTGDGSKTASAIRSPEPGFSPSGQEGNRVTVEPVFDTWLYELAKPFEDQIDVRQVLDEFLAMLDREPLSAVLCRAAYLRDLHESMPELPDEIVLDVRLEQPVVAREHQQIITGTVDRLILVRSPGRIIAAEIVDFKTGVDRSTDATSDPRRVDEYEMQMAAYRRVVSTSLKLDRVTSRLVFL